MSAPASSSAADAVRSGAGEFVSTFIEVWSLPVLGASVGGILLAGAVLAVGYFLRGTLAHWLILGAMQLAKRTATDFDDELVEALEGPVKIVPVLLSLFIAIALLGLEGGAAQTAGRIQTTLMALMVFWALYRAVDPLEHVMRPMRGTLTDSMIDWLTKALKVFFAFVGIAAALEIWGIPVGPILAGLGIFGVAVALGAQDLFKNLIAGLSILIERRFARGDWILVDGVVEGTVERINFRSTTVRRFDKSPVYVPNAKLSDNAVTNFSRMTHRRIYWKIALVYSATSEQLRYVCDKILEYLAQTPDFAKPPEVATFVFVDSFNDSSIDLMLYCFTKTTNWGEWLGVKQELALKIKEIVEEAGTEFAFPTQTMYIADAGDMAAVPDAVSAHRPRDWGVAGDARGEASAG